MLGCGDSMQVELENDGERKTAVVNSAGNIYIGKKYAGEEIDVAFEVQE